MKTWTLEEVTKYVTKVRDQVANSTLPGELGMCSVMDIDHCGSVGCIGGWMMWHRYVDDHGKAPGEGVCVGSMSMYSLEGVLTDLRAGEHRERAVGLNRLFFMWYPERPSAEQVVAACDAWLSGDEHPWPGTRERWRARARRDRVHVGCRQAWDVLRRNGHRTCYAHNGHERL